jgi:hypothetical protein
MNEMILVKAIRKLKPTAEFTFNDLDYSTIKWDVLEGEAPTQNEIDAAIEIIKAEQIAQKAAADTAKEAAQAKLSALGLTADDLKALGL